MRNALILFIGLFLSEYIQAQSYWLDDFDEAKFVAKNKKQLIVIDFWASWCGPCKMMESKLWNNPELEEISDNFVSLKINVDIEYRIVTIYNIHSIPKIIIITASGDIIWEGAGFDNNAEYYLSILKAMPENVGELNKYSLQLAENKKDLMSNYLEGIEFQRLGKNIKNTELRNSFLDCSREYLYKAQKLCDDPIKAEEIELYSILNIVYYGWFQRALKMIEKMDPMPQNENLAELRHFILAKSYKGYNDLDNYQKEKLQIKKKEFIDQLDN